MNIDQLANEVLNLKGKDWEKLHKKIREKTKKEQEEKNKEKVGNVKEVAELLIEEYVELVEAKTQDAEINFSGRIKVTFLPQCVDTLCDPEDYKVYLDIDGVKVNGVPDFLHGYIEDAIYNCNTQIMPTELGKIQKEMQKKCNKWTGKLDRMCKDRGIYSSDVIEYINKLRRY